MLDEGEGEEERGKTTSKRRRKIKGKEEAKEENPQLISCHTMLGNLNMNVCTQESLHTVYVSDTRRRKKEEAEEKRRLT